MAALDICAGLGKNSEACECAAVSAANQWCIMKLIVTLERDETGMIVAECPAIPGCISQGKTEDEALANVRDAIRVCIESRAANGMPLTVAIREVEVPV
jgi:predicted RNase H-like HicB family nuclease